LHLRLGVVDLLQVRLQLRWELAIVALPIGLELLLVLDEAFTRIRELRFEKLTRSVGKYHTIAQILLDERRGQPLGDPLGDPWIVARVTHREGITLDRLDVDVAPHPLDDSFHRQIFPFFGIEIELLDDPLQPAPTEDLFTDRSK